jgi:hypothetical protein
MHFWSIKIIDLTNWCTFPGSPVYLWSVWIYRIFDRLCVWFAAITITQEHAWCHAACATLVWDVVCIKINELRWKLCKITWFPKASCASCSMRVFRKYLWLLVCSGHTLCFHSLWGKSGHAMHSLNMHIVFAVNISWTEGITNNQLIPGSSNF